MLLQSAPRVTRTDGTPELAIAAKTITTAAAAGTPPVEHCRHWDARRCAHAPVQGCAASFAQGPIASAARACAGPLHPAISDTH